MSRECLLAGGRLLGVTRRYPQISVAAICTRARPPSDSIAFDGLSEAVLFQGSETGKVLPKTVTLSASHNPYFGASHSLSVTNSPRGSMVSYIYILCICVLMRRADGGLRKYDAHTL